MPDFELDASGLEALTRDFDESMVRFNREVDRALVEVGALVQEAAKKIAKDAGSDSIPPTIRTIPAHGQVAVLAGDHDVPLAALWELGNEGRGGRKRDYFKRPVFGHWNVKDPEALKQKRHRFLKPARSLSRHAIRDVMYAAYARVLEPIARGGESS